MGPFFESVTNLEKHHVFWKHLLLWSLWHRHTEQFWPGEAREAEKPL